MVILIMLTVFGMSLQGFFMKKYNCNESDAKISIYSFNLMLVSSAIVFFIPQIGKEFNISIELLICAIGFGLAFMGALIFNILAIKEGSLSLTSLFGSYSLIVPTMYGAWFLNEEFGIMKKVGVILLLISLFFVGNIKKGEKVSKKWFIYAVLLFLSNGLGSTVQRVAQIKSGGENIAEFMIVALIMVAIVMTVIIFGKERKIPLPKANNCGFFAIFYGLATGAVNMLTMVMAKYPATIVYPTISAGGIILTFVLAKFIFKERLSRNQYIGFVTGIISVVVLNI